MPLPTTFSPGANGNFRAFGNVTGGLTANQQAIIGGLLCVSAFGMLGYGAFFTYPAAAAGIPALGTPATITFSPAGVGVGTATFVNGGVNLTAGQMIYLAEMQAGTIGFSNGAVIAILESWGFTALSVDAIVALGVVNNTPWFGNIGGFMGGFLPHGWPGGSHGHGFPGAPPRSVYGPFGGTTGCVEIDGVQECYQYF